MMYIFYEPFSHYSAVCDLDQSLSMFVLVGFSVSMYITFIHIITVKKLIKAKVFIYIIHGVHSN